MTKERFYDELLWIFRCLAIGVIFGFIISLFIGCGSESTTPITDCNQVYTQEFCDSIRGKDGQDANQGEDSNNDAEGDGQGDEPFNTAGPEGPRGESGNSCTVLNGENGAIIECTDGTEVSIRNGNDGNNGSDSIIETIDPCGKEADYDEVLLRFSSDKLYAVYASGQKIFLTEVTDGKYITTDGTKCTFSVDNGEVTW